MFSSLHVSAVLRFVLKIDAVAKDIAFLFVEFEDAGFYIFLCRLFDVCV